MPRKRTVALLTLIGTAVAAAIVVPMLGTASAETFEDAWSDDFTGAAGTPADSRKWVYDLGYGEIWGNNEYQTYTNSVDNVRHDGDGHLVITARKEADGRYTSGRLKTLGTFTQKYGRFEARIKIPRGPGLLPAFWMLGEGASWPNGGEIDIMENVGEYPGTVYGTVHGPGYSGGGDEQRGGDTTLPNGQALSADFHTYAIEWTPNLIVWKLDGKEYHRVTPATVAGKTWVFNDRPFYMLLNVAVGGDWPGKPVDSVLPQQMIIDQVKVWKYNANGTAPAVPSAPSTTAPAKPTASARPTTSPTARPTAPASPVRPSATATPGSPAPTGRPGTAGRLVGRAGKCLNVNSETAPADSAPVSLWACHSRSNQRWTFVADGTVRAMGMCLDVAGANPASGTPLQLVGCNGNAAQQFRLGATGQLVNPMSGKCVDTRGTGTANGTPLQISRCSRRTSQTWRFQPVAG